MGGMCEEKLSSIFLLGCLYIYVLFTSWQLMTII